MTSTILLLAQGVCDELGLQPPSTLFGPLNAGDLTDRKIRRALTKTSRFLHSYWTWPALTAEHDFETTASSGATGPLTAEAGALPADFGRLVPASMRDMTNKCPVLGPVAVQLLRLPDLVRLGPAFSIRGTELYLRSPHPAGATIEFSYVRSGIARAANASLKADFTADSDTCLWSDELMHLGVVWALQSRDGVAYNGDYQAFLSRLHEEMAEAAPADVLRMGPVADPADDPLLNMPASGWGLPN